MTGNNDTTLLKTPRKSNYQPQAADTNIDADIDLFVRLRQLSLNQRIKILIAHERGVKKLCLTGIKFRHPSSSLEEIRQIFARAVLGEKFSAEFPLKSINESMWIQDSISLAGELHKIFDSIDISYYVSGGVASSIHGETRSTRDLDLVIEVRPNEINSLVKTLEAAGYYCPAGAVTNLQQGKERMLNITHTETIANPDLYITDNSPFALSQMARRILIDVDGISSFWVASPEEIILQKLLWSQVSQSEKQWRDVLGILKLQGQILDYGYLTTWAENLNLVDVFTQVLTQAGL